MTGDFNIKQNDLLPKIRCTLKDGDGVVVDLTTASSVKFMMRKRYGTTAKIDAAASIIAPATSGIVEYAWSGTDTDTTGLYQAEWEVLFPGGRETFPNASYILVRILDDIA